MTHLYNQLGTLSGGFFYGIPLQIIYQTLTPKLRKNCNNFNT
jgi:hypothetical protein